MYVLSTITKNSFPKKLNPPAVKKKKKWKNNPTPAVRDAFVKIVPTQKGKDEKVKREVCNAYITQWRTYS